MLDINKLPKGFKLLPNRSNNPEVQKRNFALSEKGEILDLNSGKILVAPEGETTITVREDSSELQWERNFHIPKLLATYFGAPKEGLSQKDFDELVQISGIPADICRGMLDAGWAYQRTTGKPSRWIKLA